MPGLSSGSSEEGHDPVWERIVWVLSRLQRAGYSRLVRPGFTDRTSSVVLAEAAPGVTSAAEIAVEINVRYKPTLD